jgi:peroxiredoxin
MVELGQLEKHAADFEMRNVRVVVASMDDVESSKLTQTDFPHLTVVADPEQRLAAAFEVLDTRAQSRDGRTANAPTTFLVDGNGQVRWVFRPDRIMERLSPAELLAAVDRYLTPTGH